MNEEIMNETMEIEPTEAEPMEEQPKGSLGGSLLKLGAVILGTLGGVAWVKHRKKTEDKRMIEKLTKKGYQIEPPAQIGVDEVDTNDGDSEEN